MRMHCIEFKVDFIEDDGFQFDQTLLPLLPQHRIWNHQFPVRKRDFECGIHDIAETAGCFLCFGCSKETASTDIRYRMVLILIANVIRCKITQKYHDRGVNCFHWELGGDPRSLDHFNVGMVGSADRYIVVVL